MKSPEIIIKTIGTFKGPIAEVCCDEVVVFDGQSALGLIINVSYETDTEKMVIHKEMIAEEFFDLDTGLAEEVLQKSVNYQIKIAICGDFSAYDRQSFKRFAEENNQDVYFIFAESLEEAIKKLEEI